MDADDLFLNTLKDLEARSAAADEYEVLLSAGLLRKLLMDGTPLVDVINQVHRLKVRFPINAESPYEHTVLQMRPVYWSLEDGIDPGTDAPPGLQAPVEASRDQLLRRRVMRVKGHDVTVRDLIDQLAHVEGAVHIGNPQDKRAEVLKEVSRTIYIGGLPAGVRQMRSIARVVARGLIPLRDAVLAVRAGPSIG